MAFAALMLVAAACGDDDPAATSSIAPTTTGSTEAVVYTPPTGAGDVILRMVIGVNQPDPLAILEAFPEFTLYGDGRLLVSDPDTRGASLRSLIEFQVDPAGIQLLLAAAGDHGALDPLDSYGSTDVADSDTTSFVVDAGSDRATFGVYNVTGQSGDITSEQLAARADLVELRDLLRDFRAVLGDDIVSEQPFVPQGVAVFGVERGSGAELMLPFDLETTGDSVETRIDSVQCLIATGPDVDDLALLLAGTDRGTRWLVNGASWAIVFRPVLPDEGGCAELASG